MKIKIDNKSFVEIGKKSFVKAQKERARGEREMDMAIKLVQPVRKLFRTQRTRQFDRTVQYDATAIMALANTQTMVQSLSWPTGTKSFDMGVKKEHKPFYNSDIILKRKIQIHNDVTEDTMRHSGFHNAWGLTLFDILGPGTGIMAKYLDPVEGPKWFNAPITEFYLLWDERTSQFHRVFRKFKMTVMDIVKKYSDGDDARRLPKVVQQCYTRQEFDEEFEVLDVQMTFDNVDYFGCVMAESWELLTDVEKLPSKIYYPIRWQPIPGEHWGDGLVRQALPHIQTAHAVRRLQLKHAEFAALGAWQAVSDSIFNWNNKKIQAGKVFPTSAELKALTLPGNIDILEPILQREEKAITRILLADLIPPPENDKDVNNYVFGQRLRLFIERAGAPAQNMENEGLRAMVEGHVKDLEYIRILEPLTTENDLFEFRINSIIQKGRENEDVMRNLETIQMIANLTEQTGDQSGIKMVNMKNVAKKIFDARGFWPDCLLSDEELEQLLNTENAMASAQQGMGMAGQLAELAGAANQTGINSNNMPEAIKNAINSIKQSGAAASEAVTQ